MNDHSGGRVGHAPPAGVREAEEYTGSDPRELRAQVERTRARLGDTVEELASRADVRAIARRGAAGARERLTRPRPVVLIAAGAAVAVCAAGAMVLRHRHGGR